MAAQYVTVNGDTELHNMIQKIPPPDTGNRDIEFELRSMNEDIQNIVLLRLSMGEQSHAPLREYVEQSGSSSEDGLITIENLAFLVDMKQHIDGVNWTEGLHEDPDIAKALQDPPPNLFVAVLNARRQSPVDCASELLYDTVDTYLLRQLSGPGVKRQRIAGLIVSVDDIKMPLERDWGRLVNRRVFDWVICLDSPHDQQIHSLLIQTFANTPTYRAIDEKALRSIFFMLKDPALRYKIAIHYRNVNNAPLVWKIAQ